VIWQAGAYSPVNLAINATANLGSVTALADIGLSVSLVGRAAKGRVRPILLKNLNDRFRATR
jgi:hypothetical protein